MSHKLVKLLYSAKAFPTKRMPPLCGYNPFFFFFDPIGLDYIKRHLKDQPAVQPGDTGSQSSDDDDFFFPIKRGRGRAHENTKQLESYLANPDDAKGVLKSYPAVCHLSLKLNTALPASAACERLFSTAGLILST